MTQRVVKPSLQFSFTFVSHCQLDSGKHVKLLGHLHADLMRNQEEPAVSESHPKKPKAALSRFVVLLGIMVIFTGFALAMIESHPIPGYIVGPIPGTKVYLDLVGFLIPLVASLLFVYAFLLQYNKPHIAHFSAYTIVIVVLAVVDYIFSPPWYHVGQNSGSHIDFLMYGITVGFLLFYLLKGWIKTVTILSFPLLFLLGALSDIDAVSHLKGPLYFGGSSIIDADFLFPLLFSCTMALLLIVSKGSNSQRENGDPGRDT